MTVFDRLHVDCPYHMRLAISAARKPKLHRDHCEGQHRQRFILRHSSISVKIYFASSMILRILIAAKYFKY